MITRATTEMPEVRPSSRWMLLCAGDLMRTDVVTVTYDAPVSELVEILTDHRVSGLPVTTQAGVIVGIVSLRDVIDRYPEYRDAWPTHSLFYRDLENDEASDDFDESDDPTLWDRVEQTGDTVGDIMTAEVITVPADAGICEISALMSQKRIHRVVVERDGVYLGIISTLDILDALTT